jgi:hypothetical protein
LRPRAFRTGARDPARTGIPFAPGHASACPGAHTRCELIAHSSPPRWQRGGGVRNDAYLQLLLCEQRQGAAHSGTGDGSRLYPATGWDENPDERRGPPVADSGPLQTYKTPRAGGGKCARAHEALSSRPYPAPAPGVSGRPPGYGWRSSAWFSSSKTHECSRRFRARQASRGYRVKEAQSAAFGYGSDLLARRFTTLDLEQFFQARSPIVQNPLARSCTQAPQRCNIERFR